MTVVGEAAILIRPVTTGFEAELKKESEGALTGFRKDAEVAGASAGAGLRGGVTKETSKLSGDLEKHGNAAGSALSSGIGKGLLVVGAAAVAAAGEAAHLAESMQSADASIAAASGTSVKSATAIGNAFLDTAGKSEFSGQQMAKAYAAVAGQLKATEGHALDAAQASKVMAAADDLATAKQIDLGTATSTLAGIMQAFHLKAGDASHASDVLFSASTATGQSVDALGSALTRVKSRLGDTGGSVGDLSALLVDMTNQGITGRGAMGALNTSMTTLQRTAGNVSTAEQTQQTVLAQMSPSLRALAKGYQDGSISQKDYTKETGKLSGSQKLLATQFTTAQTAIATARTKYKELGVTVFDAQGKFVGMGSIIDQLQPRFAKMTQAQQLAAATTLFGAGAAKQMTAVINAGPAAYDKATRAVNQHGAAQSAAAKQASTLHVEEETLKATAIDLGTKIGAVLVPAITAFAGTILHATTFVMGHKAVLIALAAVVTGVLGTAIAVFTVNKMAQFGQSFVTASGHVKSFVGDVQTGVSKVIGLFGKQTDAADAMSTKVGAATKATSGAVATEATEIEASNATTEGSFASVGASSTAAATEVGASEATMTTEVAGADGAIEADNAAAGGSFAALGAAAKGALASLTPLLSALGVAAAGTAAGVGLGNAISGGRGVNPGSSPNNPLPNSPGGGGVNTSLPLVGNVHVGGPVGSALNLLGIGNVATQHHAKFPKTAADAGMALGFTSSLATARPRARAASSGLPGFSGAQNQTAASLFSMFTGAGLSPAGAAALIGNFAQESSLNLNEPGGLLAQWGGSRLTGEASFAAANHESATSLGAEGGFVLKELQGYPGLLSMLKSTTNPQAAALAVSNQYERPLASKANNPNREAQAAAALAAFTGMAPGSIPAGVAGTAGNVALKQTPAEKVAAEIKSETAKVNSTIKSLEASLKGTAGITFRGQGPNPGVANATAAAAQVAALKAALAVQTAQQKASLGTQTASQKAELAKQTSDVNTGTKQLASLLKDVHSGNLKTLTADLNRTHDAALKKVESSLDHDHSTALAALSAQLVKVHQEAMSKLVADEKQAATAAAKQKAAANATAAATAATNAQIAGLDMAGKMAADSAKQQADQIADSTKVFLDQQAQTGLTGSALLAAQAQTSFDQITAGHNQALDAQQTAVDQASAGSATQQAAAALSFAQVQAIVTIEQARAQSLLDKANAAATADANAASSTPAAGAPTTATAPAVTNNFSIFGNGTLTASDLFREVGWALTTGALPVAAPASAPVPVAA